MPISIPAKVRILAGPARSGKTAALLVRYRQILAEQPDGNASGAALWLAPTKYAAAEIRGQLLQDGLIGCFSPGVYTFEQFAQTVLAASDQPPRYLGRLLKRQLIQRLLAEAHAASRLQYFAPIADTAGLVDLIDGLISDLKRQEVWPERFSQLIETVAPSEKNREIAAVYTEYRRLLDRQQMYDIEGRFWIAGKLLRETPPQRWGPLAHVKHIMIDGFTDFTRSQHELLKLLTEKSPALGELTITLPLEEKSNREDLFDKPQRTLDQLQKLHSNVLVHWQPRPAASDWPGLAHVERHLFCNPREVKAAADTNRIEIIAAAGQKAEIEALARRIKKLLVLGDDQRGNPLVRPGEIAVVFRSVEPLASLVEEVFTEYGIPVVLDSPPRLQRSPVLQALLAMLRLQAGDWPFRQLLAVLSNNYFQPRWPEWQDGRSAAAVEWAVRQVQAPKGRKTLLSVLERWAKSDDPAARAAAIEATADCDPLDEDDAQRRQEHRRRYGIALAVLSQLAKVLPSVDKARQLSEWLGILQGVVDHLGLLRGAEDGNGAIPNSPSFSHYDQQAWQRLKNVLSAGNQLERWLEVEPAALTLLQFIGRLQDVLSVEQLPIERDEAGRVRVLSAHSVRALSVPYVFVAGMAEKVFPPPARDDRIYSDVEYRRLNEAGLHFVDGRHRGCEEMLLFYEVVTRPTQRLTLSYPALDETAQPLLPSPYLTELERCGGEGQIARTVDISLSPVPQHEHPFSLAEQRTKAVAELVENKPQRLAQLISDHRSVLIPDGKEQDEGGSAMSPNIVAALRAIAARRQRESFGPFEGMLTGEATKQRLQQLFGPEHCWSVSRLEEYAYCPFQFLAKNILSLEELPELALEVDYGRRGQLAHEALATLHRRLNAAGKHSSPGGLTTDEYQELREGTLSTLVESIPRGSPLEIALRTVDLRLIGQWLQQYIGQHLKYDEAAAIDQVVQEQSLRPAHFEVSFGLKPRTNEELDPLSTAAPFELLCDGDTFRFSGRIDRIDIGLVGGQIVFNVLDYKTGSSKNFKRSFASGVALQLPLYALAVQELLMIDRRAVPWRVGYWFLKEKGFDDYGLPQFFERAEVGLRETTDWQTLRGTLLNRVASLVRGIRGGLFPVFSLDDDCTSSCPYRTVCRIGQIRSLDKTWNMPALNATQLPTVSVGKSWGTGRT
jgi:ATP-dependent helicase/DNAse subunit B